MYNVPKYMQRINETWLRRMSSLQSWRLHLRTKRVPIMITSSVTSCSIKSCSVQNSFKHKRRWSEVKFRISIPIWHYVTRVYWWGENSTCPGSKLSIWRWVEVNLVEKSRGEITSSCWLTWKSYCTPVHHILNISGFLVKYLVHNNI